MRAQPAYQIENVGIAPHPLRKPAKVVERLDGLLILACTADVAIDSICIRPVGLGCDGSEALLEDQPLAELRADAVELVRPVGCLAEEHQASISDPIDQGIEVGRAA